MDTKYSPEADVLVEKTTRATAALDVAQREIHDALIMLDESEREAVGSTLKATLQLYLITRLCHMTLGGMGMDEAQVNAIAVDMLGELNKLGRDLQKDAARAAKGH